jgi:hypothetical protein
VGGIEGSGHTVTAGSRITTSGAVTSLGSIFVNGVEYDLAGATITIDGASATQADLAPGLVTIVEGDVDPDGTHGAARRVTVQIAVAGPISAVDVDAGRVTILGQSIEVEQGTIIDGGQAGSPLGGLDVGRDVEVSGFADPSGAVHARRIAARRAGTPLLVTGYVASLDTSAHVFSVNGQPVSYATASVNGFASGLSAGAPVRVAVTGFDRSTLVAEDVSFRDPRLPGVAGDAAAVEGLVTRFGSGSDFDVDGHPVATSAPIGSTAAARLGEFVKVSGDLIANGVVLATNLEGAHALLDGTVTIDGVRYEIKGPLTPEGAFRLNIAADSFGGAETDSGLGQIVGELDAAGEGIHGSGVLIGESCGRSPAPRFCGVTSPVRVDLSETVGQGFSGFAGAIRVTTVSGEEVWPVDDTLGRGAPTFFGPPRPVSSFQGRYAVHQAEFTSGGAVLMDIDDEGRLFLQSAKTGCTANGVLVHHEGTDLYDWDLYDVTLTIAGCQDSFAYLNADYEGLSELGSLGQWDYDFATLRFWLSTRAGSPSPAAITLWATWIASEGEQRIPRPVDDVTAE